MGCDCDFEPQSIELEKYKVVKEIDKNVTDISRSYLLRSSTNANEYVCKSVNVVALNKGEKDIILNEINVLKKINNPNVIDIKNSYYSKDNKFLNIITEYAEDGTLQKKYEEQKKKKQYFKGNDLLDWFIQILLALKYIHERKILHRDIKPSNIFLMKDMAKNGYHTSIFSSRSKEKFKLYLCSWYMGTRCNILSINYFGLSLWR